MNASIIRNFEQVIAQRFPFLLEAGLHELEKSLGIGDSEGCPIAGKGHSHQRRINLWRRTESAGRNAQSDFRFGVKLAQGGKVSVIADARMRGDALGNFELNHSMD